jgi:large conductance mechanosensitive channel
LLKQPARIGNAKNNREGANMLKEFKEFALRGNVIDLAVGVIIGGAFGKIVSSLVNDILMPAIGVLLGGVNFTNLKYVITPASGNAAEVAILYGAFIQSIVDFLIIAFSVFLFVKLLSSRKKKSEAPPAPPAPPREVILLEEIRDLLKSKHK